MTAKKPLKLCYLGGPGDALDVYKSWATGATLEYFGANYLKQFYQVCADLNAEGLVILAAPGEYSSRSVPGFILEHRPTPDHLRGAAYYVGLNLWMLRIAIRIALFRPDVAVLTAHIGHCLPLLLLKLFRIRVIPALHDTPWKRFKQLSVPERFLKRSLALFFSCCATDFLVAAETTAAQVRALVPNKKIKVEIFLPNYAREQFSGIKQAVFETPPFRVLFMGRTEINKGVFDLLEIASKLDPQEFHFDLCGVGSQSEELMQAIKSRSLSGIVSYHGFLSRMELYKLWDESHMVIVPTTTDFQEGFNMVCSEAILAGRPVVTSAVCPALFYIRDAAIEVQPNNVDEYRAAVVELCRNNNLYRQKQAACSELGEQFYNEANSYGAKLRIVLDRVLGSSRKPA